MFIFSWETKPQGSQVISGRTTSWTLVTICKSLFLFHQMTWALVVVGFPVCKVVIFLLMLVLSLKSMGLIKRKQNRKMWLWSHVIGTRLIIRADWSSECLQSVADRFESCLYSTKHLHECGNLVLDSTNTWLCSWRIKRLFVESRKTGFVFFWCGAMLVSGLGWGQCGTGWGRRPSIMGQETQGSGNRYWHKEVGPGLGPMTGEEAGHNHIAWDLELARSDPNSSPSLYWLCDLGQVI